MSDVTLTANGASVILHGDGEYQGPGIALTGIAGWYATPDPKITVTSRGQGDGGHDIAASDILYSARVVTISYRVLAGDRHEHLTCSPSSTGPCMVSSPAASPTRDRTRNASAATTAGALSRKIQNPLWQNLSGDITLVFERPERLSVNGYTVQISAMHVAGGNVGLKYGDNRRNGLKYPLNYGLTLDGVGSNVALLTNSGSSRAYPTFVVHGPMDGVRLDFPGTQQSIVCGQTVRDVPLVLDCRSRTAELGGQDVSRQLSQRGFPTIPPGGSIRVVPVKPR